MSVNEDKGPPGFVPASLEKLTQVTRLSDTIYAADLASELCVGSVPNGGYVASVILRVAQEYLAPRDQRDTMHTHIQYLSRTQAGPAYLVVEEAKMGRNTSVLHISVHQQGLLATAPFLDGGGSDAAAAPKGRKARVTAYVTNTNLAKQSGITLPTSWKLPDAPAPVDLGLLSCGQDRAWTRIQVPLMRRIPSVKTLDFFAQRAGHVSNAAHDYWVRCANGEPFTSVSLGFVADAAAAMIPESYRQEDAGRPPRDGEIRHDQAYWYPTVTLSIDVKKKLPEPEEGEGGARWLRLRAASKAIRNGRSDLEIVIFDQGGELVALSHHVAMVLDFSRNLSGRRQSSPAARGKM
ncbi:thioesterase family protein [Moelleriella libera RCEF 2490]|uniref:Thioesterase family protein n=1 Tax=Moelleriella libera RCEF 2490 TaxID=1081109 RepID=A0A168D3V7_9HYPO|nr:thioesterase family protein [Moelleriella libera RCEF 2490]